MTYPSDGQHYHLASERVRRVARETYTTLIDFEMSFKQEGRSDLLQRTGHPTAAGHQLMAEMMVPFLKKVLKGEEESPGA